MYSFNGNVQYTECSQHIFNKHLKFIYDKLGVLRLGKYKDFQVKIPGSYFLDLGNSILRLSYKYGDEWINLKTDMYKDYNLNYIDEVSSLDGGRAYAYFKRYVKIPDISLPINPVAAFTYCNPNYVNQRFDNVIGYDRNAAYLGACDNLIIPKKLIDYDRAPKENEIGFGSQGIPIYGPSNFICGFIFEAGTCEGLQRWHDKIVEKYLNKDTNVKAYYQYAIGMIRRHNIVLYNTIIYASNYYMNNLIDENTLWSTTDSLVSLKERPDLIISMKPGDFKIEHDFNTFAYTKHGYQWGLEPPRIKGFSRSKVENYNKTHKDKFDILHKDKYYVDKRKYTFKEGYIVDEEDKKI